MTAPRAIDTARTRAVDDNDWQQLDSQTKEAVKDILRQKTKRG